MLIFHWWLFLIGCDPLASHVREEAVWYDTQRIATEAGVSLVQIDDGEPIGHWSRIVVRSTGIDIDNRAWILTLPPEAFARDPIPQPHVFDTVMPLEDGHLPKGTSTPLDPVMSALFELKNQHQQLASDMATTQLEVDHPITVIPEPNVPWSTLKSVLYTTQNVFHAFAIVGDVNGHLRHPGTGDNTEACPLSLTTVLSPTMAWLHPDLFSSGEWLPPLTGRGGCGDMDGLVDAAVDLANACIQYREQDPNEDTAETPLVDCVSVSVRPSDELTAAALLNHQSRLYQAWPTVRQGNIIGGFPESHSCDRSISVNELSSEQLEAFCTASAAAHLRQVDEVNHVQLHLANVFSEYIDWRKQQGNMADAERRSLPVNSTETTPDGPDHQRERVP